MSDQISSSTTPAAWSQSWEEATRDGSSIRVVARAVDESKRYADETAEVTARKVVREVMAESKRDEDARADKRNRNRAYTLVVAVLMTFLVPYVVANILHDAAILKYATGIAIVPDALITLWAYVKKY